MNNFAYASFSRRFLAFFLDAFIYLFALSILSLFFLLPALLLGFLAAFSQFAAMAFASFLWIFGTAMLLTTHWLYYAGCEYSIHQATPGKALLGLKVCNYQGQRLNFKQATIRYLSRFLSALILGLGYLGSLFNRRHQTLHDSLAKTLVLQCPRKISGQESP
ncbi:MAG: RDD family protein [Proteobacteria bacterium]|nr:RDD family protein [Pseudomonadota bacterium]